jgi:hypothetical protein
MKTFHHFRCAVHDQCLKGGALTQLFSKLFWRVLWRNLENNALSSLHELERNWLVGEEGVY